MAGQIKASPRNKLLGKAADKLAQLKTLANKYEVLPQVPLLGGTGIGDLLMGQAPEEVNNWAYGNPPMQVPEMSNVPQLKTGRAQSVADTLFLGSDLGALGTVAAKLGKSGLSNIAGSAGRAMAPGAKSQLGVIKLKGGNSDGERLNQTMRTLKRFTFDDTAPDAYGNRTPNPMAQTPVNLSNVAVNDWVDKTLQKYVKNEMATPEDPVRALAERGISHKPGNPDDYFNLDSYALEDKRRKAGFPTKGVAERPAAKSWEDMADLAIDPYSAERLRNSGEPFMGQTNLERMPWLEKLDPNTPVYRSYDLSGPDIGFTHLIDELTNATNPESGLPRELLLKYDALPRVTVPQAVERVAKINEWRANQKVEADMMRANNQATQVFKEYPDQGYKWVELKADKELPKGYEIVETPELGGFEVRGPKGTYAAKTKESAIERFFKQNPDKSLEDALKYEGETMGHCVGGYCPDVVEGRSRIYSLRDSKGQPHVTVEVQPKDWFKSITDKSVEESEPFTRRLKQELDLSGVDLSNKTETDRIGNQVYAEMFGEIKPSIIQIKGKGNAAPKADYLPFVQDFVKSQQWSDVGDLGNTGLVEYSSRRQTIPRGLTGVIPKFSEAGIQPGYFTESELSDLVKAWQTTNGSRNFAQGGLVTHYDPSRIEALVSQLMDEQ